MFIKKTERAIAVNFVKLLGIIALSIFFSTNSYSKTLKTEIVSENEYGGIYAIKLPMFSAKRRWQPTFDKINDMAEKNCNIYSSSRRLVNHICKNFSSSPKGGKIFWPSCNHFPIVNFFGR